MGQTDVRSDRVRHCAVQHVHVQLPDRHCPHRVQGTLLLYLVIVCPNKDTNTSQGILLVMGVVISVLTRKVSMSMYNESKYIGLAVSHVNSNELFPN